MALGSSSQAAAGTLRHLAETPGLDAADRDTLTGLAGRAAGQATSSKAERLLMLLAAKEEYLRQRGHDDRLFGDPFAPDR
jgi:hypothetical protein